jgi:hypothetical protein
MDIWLSFLPGSAATSIEMILRSCTDLDCLPVTENPFVEKDQIITSHVVKKQWHPKTERELKNPLYRSCTDNIFTPIVPMRDYKGNKILEHMAGKPGIKFYLGPAPKLTSIEFAVITKQKVPTYPEDTINFENTDQWSTNELENWELRESISLQFMQWFVPEMIEQWQTAENLGFTCINTQNIFAYYPQVVDNIIETIGCNITDLDLYRQYVQKWFDGQNKIWDDWHSYKEYKQGTGRLTGDIVQEAMIQYNLRERGIELKCYGLNEFPDAQTLKDFYG